MSSLRIVSCTVLRLLLAFSFIVVTTRSTFCPVTSPSEEIVYVTDPPSNVIIGATRPQCGLECQRVDTVSRWSIGQPGCRCFNYNSTSANCSLFSFEPNNFSIDREGNTIAYQFSDRPLQFLTTNLWLNVTSDKCSFPIVYNEHLYCQQCIRSTIFATDRYCARRYDWCHLANGERAFCSNGQAYYAQVSSATNQPTDCTDIAALGCTDSGVYTIYIGSDRRNVSVYCDMTTNNALWTLFQRRMNGSVNFYRTWSDYANGFGELTGEFWLGNDNLNLLTSAKRYTLRIDMSTFNGTTSYAEYDNFKVNSADDNYRLASVGSFRGPAGDSLTSRHSGQQFSTYDKNNRLNTTTDDCAVHYHGAWWYGTIGPHCHLSNLNGKYYGGPHSSFADGVEWQTWTGYHYSLKTTEMKIRPV